MPLKCIWRIFC